MIADHTTGASIGDRYRRKNGSVVFEVIKLETDASLAQYYNFTDQIITLRRVGGSQYTVCSRALNGFRHDWVKMCAFNEAYRGRCPEAEPCPKHSDLKCWCGAPATQDCDKQVLGLMCGASLCERHENACKMHNRSGS